MKQDCFFIKRQKTLQNRNFKSERTLYLEAQNPANSNAESGKILRIMTTYFSKKTNILEITILYLTEFLSNKTLGATMSNLTELVSNRPKTVQTTMLRLARVFSKTCKPVETSMLNPSKFVVKSIKLCKQQCWI